MSTRIILVVMYRAMNRGSRSRIDRREPSFIDFLPSPWTGKIFILGQSLRKAFDGDRGYEPRSIARSYMTMKKLSCALAVAYRSISPSLIFFPSPRAGKYSYFINQLEKHFDGMIATTSHDPSHDNMTTRRVSVCSHRRAYRSQRAKILNFFPSPRAGKKFIFWAINLNLYATTEHRDYEPRSIVRYMTMRSYRVLLPSQVESERSARQLSLAEHLKRLNEKITEMMDFAMPRNNVHKPIKEGLTKALLILQSCYTVLDGLENLPRQNTVEKEVLTSPIPGIQKTPKTAQKTTSKSSNIPPPPKKRRKSGGVKDAAKDPKSESSGTADWQQVQRKRRDKKVTPAKAKAPIRRPRLSRLDALALE
ncbi:unnamed protein product [Trichogramma brassicae]|uniref:Uncharacterized protein n=1 Tax=Trichogramma brassicae TaxID=86971 RepID=A0A6H5IYG3_9HYME|nr:unnamed protein product [Trichogramma brassicae]